jgi:hypothetical protein
MARDHYIPASVIGRFSVDPSTSARERFVFVGRRGQPEVFRVKAGQFGSVNDLYRVKTQIFWGPYDTDSAAVDRAVSGYESALPEALDGLDGGERIGLQSWLRTLVPFVASLFVRGNDFAGRFEARPGVAASGLSSSDNTNGARALELQRLLAPVMGARWVVLHQTAGEPFLLNDLGLMPTLDLVTDERGWAIPIGLHAVLGLFPRTARTIAKYRAGFWYPVIEHRYVDAMETHSFNDAMAESAMDWIAGPDGEVVQQYLSHLNRDSHNAQDIMEGWPFDQATKVAHDRDWHRLVSATTEEPTPDDIGDLQDIDAEKLARTWCPPIFLTLNMAEQPTGLRCSGDSIRLTLHEPDHPL